MSRFFAASSESETESEVSEDEVPQKAQPIAAYAVSDDEEDEKRVVKTAKEKRYDEMQEIIRQLKNHKKIKDVTNVLSSFEELFAAYTKAIPVIQKEDHGVTPRFFVRALAEVEDFVNELWELGNENRKKNMSKNNAKSLGTLRQKMKKMLKDFEGDIAKFRETAGGEEEEPEQAKVESESESEDEGPEAFVKDTAKTKTAKPAKMDDEESDDSYWGSESDSDESSSSEEDDTKYTSIREKFLKRTTMEEEERKKREKKEKKEKEKEKRRLRQQEDAKEDGEAQGGDWEVVRGGAAMPVKPKMFDKNAEINVESVIKKLNEVISARGKKGTNKAEMVDMLQELHEIAEANNLGPGVSVRVRLALVAAIFDYNTKVSDAMKVEHWDKLLQTIDQLIEMLHNNPDITLSEHVMEENEELQKPPYKIRGCILTVVERMDAEFTKILKELDCHSNEYVIRLSDEHRVIDLIDRVTAYVERQGVPSDICRAYVLKIDHIYYKIDMRALDETTKEPTSLDTMDRLCKFICAKDSTDRLRQRAVLYQIYHLALHNRWYAARNLMLMSHLQESIQHSDPATQILYNRAMVQLGMCAFRHGSIKDAHNALLDIQSGGRAKELLAQGLLMTRQYDRTQEQEKIEKQRQIPFHMQINLELLECVYLVSAMLIEIPYMAAHESDARRRMISKSFHHQLKVSERQAVTGPPESMREHVVAAAKAMRNGNWEACKNYLINDKMNVKVWSLFKQGDVRPILIRKIQEESVRTYLFTFSGVFDSLSVNNLSKMFQLEPRDVHSVVSKMIIREELMASLDEPTQSIVMHRTEPSRLQSNSLQLADKLLSFVENNERVLEIRQGTRLPPQQGYRDRLYGRRDDNRGNVWASRGDRGDRRRVNFQE